MTYLVLKLSDKDREIPMNTVDLIKRANGTWRMTLSKLGKTNKAVLLFRGQVLADLDIGPNVTWHRDSNRISLDTQLSTPQIYKRKHLAYRTANPASIIKDNNLENYLV